jgi:plasmid stabilization system protein ParE
MVPEVRRLDIREVFVQSYRVVYHVRDAAILVLTVYHGARASLRETLDPRIPSP